MKENNRKKNRILLVILAVFTIILFVSFFISLVIRYDPDLLIFSQDSERIVAAIKKNDVDELRRLLEEGCDPNQPTLPPGKFWSFWEMTATRPISVACLTGSYEMVELLINYGATAEYVEYTSWSPLYVVLDRYEESDYEIVKLLLSNGADPQLIESGTSCLHHAAYMSPYKTYAEFEESNRRHKGESFKGFVDGLYDAICVALQKEQTPSITDIGEYNPLAATEITRIVELLLNEESINAVSSSGESLLICAVRVGNYNLVSFLLSKRCDPDIKDCSGKTAYDYAVEAQDEYLISLLSD